MVDVKDPSHRPGRVRPVPYLPALDGLRAIAVVAVVLYHAGVGWMPGGFLGVDVFFVISGFLISSLLLTELTGNGRVDLRAFWMRRFRRLLPALGLLLLVVLSAGLTAYRRDLVRFRGDLAAATTYSTNWFLVFTKRSYFDQIGRPSPLLHLWSLAVEEQFYLLWPLLFPAFIVRQRRRSRSRAGVAWRLLFGAALSSLVMAVLFDPRRDPSRVYFGTDTRAAPLLVGAALAVWWLPVVKDTGGRAARWRGWWVDAIGALMIGALIIIMVLTHDSDGAGLATHHRDAWLYRGGFLAVALMTAVLIAVVSRPGARLARPLSLRGMRWIGERSYGIYLWHWPVVVVTRPGVDVDLHGPALLVLRLAATVVAAELSYRFVEQPVRRGQVGGWFRRLTAGPRWWQASAAAISAAALAVIVALVSTTTAPLDPIERSLREGEAALRAHVDRPSDTSVPVPPTVVSAPATTLVVVDNGPTTTAADATVTTTTLPPPVGRVDVRVLAVGDSVMLGAAPALTKRLGKGSTIDAAVNRQFFQGARIITTAQRSEERSVIVVIHLGNNGIFTRETLDKLLDQLTDTPLVILTRLSSPRDYAATLNGYMDDEARRRTNVAVLDWETIVRQHPDVLYTDHLHMRPEGATLYADAMVDVMATFCLDTSARALVTVTLPSPSTSSTTSTTALPIALLPDGRRVLDRCRAWTPPTTSTSVPTTTVKADVAVAIPVATTAVAPPTPTSNPSTGEPPTTAPPAPPATTSTLLP